MKTKSQPKPKPKQKPKPMRPAAEADFELDVVGEWSDEHTKVVAQLLVDLEETRTPVSAVGHREAH